MGNPCYGLCDKMSKYSPTGFYRKLGARIRALRVRAGLSQAALGARLGRSASAVDRYEMGQRRIALAELVRMAEILGVTPETLLTAGPGRRRSAMHPTAPPAADLRAEHRRLLRELDRRLSVSAAAHGDAWAEDRGSYASRPPGGSAGTPRGPAQSFPDGRLRQWARTAGFPPTVALESLRRYAILVLQGIGQADRARR